MSLVLDKKNKDQVTFENLLIKQGTFPISQKGKIVGQVDISHWSDKTYVSIQLVDTFLTIEEIMGLMRDLKENFGLSDTQQVSFQQI